MAKITHTYKLFNKEKAIEIAHLMNSDIYDDWVYTAVHCPKGTGYSFINIHDEDGEFVGKV